MISIQPLRDLRPCLPFALAINADPCLGDPMLRSQEQLQINLLSAQDKASHQAFGAYEGERLAGLFVFLILPDERYIEMLAGLTREPAAWKAMLARTVALNRPKGMSLLVDADIGFGSSAFNVARTVKSMIKAGAAGLHIEDQVGAKRCGHRPNKAIVSKEEMVDRIRAAVDAKTDPDFVIMARTDALAVEGLDAAIERAQAYVEAGAEMLFPEAITELAMYRQFADAVQVPILANITEFGATPLFTTDELRSAHVAMALYPLSAFRAMNRAAEHVYNVLRQEGTQKSVIDTMQTRNELYESINYYQYEEKLDELFARSQVK